MSAPNDELGEAETSRRANEKTKSSHDEESEQRDERPRVAKVDDTSIDAIDAIRDAIDEGHVDATQEQPEPIGKGVGGMGRKAKKSRGANPRRAGTARPTTTSKQRRGAPSQAVLEVNGARRLFATSALLLLVGIGLSAIDQAALGSWIAIAGLVGAIWGTHKLGRVGVDGETA